MSVVSNMSIEECIRRWGELEELKINPKQTILELTKQQSVFNQHIRNHMIANNIDELDCGNGYVIVCSIKGRAPPNKKKKRVEHV